MAKGNVQKHFEGIAISKSKKHFAILSVTDENIQKFWECYQKKGGTGRNRIVANTKSSELAKSLKQSIDTYFSNQEWKTDAEYF